MKRVATVTLHRAENFGSVLQAYALQHFVESIGDASGKGVEYRILDVRPRRQEELYSLYRKGFGARSLIKNIVAFRYRKQQKAKKQKFACFLEEHLHLSRHMEIEELYRETPRFDCFISGSDQIFNVRSLDFEDYFYLDFVKDAKKISYAASFGPLAIDWSQYDSKKYASLLGEYAHISTREEGSRENVEKLTGAPAKIHVDPTLLLGREEWRKLQSGASYRGGRYILLYCLEPSREQLRTVRAIAAKLRLPVLITRYNNKHDILNGFIKLYDAGPADFLSLLDHAALVITSSFHGTAFSLIYRKRFYVLNGKDDRRICDLLEKTALLGRSLDGVCDVGKVTLQDVDFSATEEFLEEQQRRSRAYLKQALEL